MTFINDKRHRATLSALVLGFALAAPACSEPEPILPASLRAPRAIAVAQGEVCLPPVSADFATIGRGALLRCESGQQGAIALIVNEQTDNVAVADLSGRRAQLVNLDSTTPGVAHIPVGRHPVGVAAGNDGTVAYVINQLDRTLTPLNLWLLRPMSAQPLEGIPRRVAIASASEGQVEQLVVALASPSRLQLRDAMRCEQPTNVSDRRTHRADAGCSELGEATTLDLPASVADLAVAPDGSVAYVVYSDLNAMSVIGLTTAALEGDDAACSQAPCELGRIALAEPLAPSWGFSAIGIDPLGKFVYVVDRANNQVLFVDAARRELVDAALATEPPAMPFSTLLGAGVTRSPIVVTGDVSRNVLWSGNGRSLIRYAYGAYVASDNGSIYFVEAMNAHCELEHTGELLSARAFYNDHAARAASPEQSCLTVPEFPLAEANDDTLDHRLFVDANARVAINPTFAPRDARAASGRLVGRASCQLPEALIARASELTGAATLSCGSPVLPQPTSLQEGASVPTSLAEIPRATLLAQRSLVLLPPEGTSTTVREGVRSEPFDLRLRDESWTVTYEGVLPATARIDRGVVDRDVDARFQGGGIDLCAAGVQPGDRLTILGRPEIDGAVPASCAAYVSDDTTRADFLTYEIVGLSAEYLELAVIEDEELGFVDQLPSRACAAFNRGLRYNIRPVDQWLVVGERSGLIPEHENVGGECVARPGAEFGRANARARTGESFSGPYLDFRIHEGELDPVRDMSYSFQVERNFVAERYESRTPLPSQVLFLRNLPQGHFLIAPDGTADFVSIQNLAQPQEGARTLR
ncbi:MAG: hypothetical protein H0U74_21645 [Bradymonadaceae bacterium]|nr:hypothetical protein [Lujinxingiaceae bacterium]